MRAKSFTDEGIRFFKTWLDERADTTIPSTLMTDAEYVQDSYDVEVDSTKSFDSRYSFGAYLVEIFKGVDHAELMSQTNDGLWAWLAATYFKQLAGAKPKRYEHYIVTHKGAVGSLAYRHDVRTSYQMVYAHGEKALVCLEKPMHVWGEVAEQIISRQRVALNHGFFDSAYSLYISAGKLKKGAASRPKKPSERKPGDTTGKGGARRLAVALDRLTLTFDVDVMDSANLLPVLPREFSRWKTAAN